MTITIYIDISVNVGPEIYKNVLSQKKKFKMSIATHVFVFELGILKSI